MPRLSRGSSGSGARVGGDGGVRSLTLTARGRFLGDGVTAELLA